MQRVFLLHKGLKLTAKSIEVIKQAVNGISKKDRKFYIVDSLADASIVVVGDDVYPKKELLTADETEGLPVYPTANLIAAIKEHTRVMTPEERDQLLREKEAEEAALAALPHADISAASGPFRRTGLELVSPGPYERSSTGASTVASPLPAPEVEEILAMLSEFSELYEIKGDSFRGKGYKVAYEWLMSYPDIDLLSVEHIAPSVKEKIRELTRTGRCQKLEALRKSDKLYEWKRELMLIHGVGAVLADKWARSYGIKSIQQLRDTVKLGSIRLTEAQTVGLKYYDDFKERIPRAEVEQMAETVKRAAIDDLGWRIEVVVCGSYRRGKETCGDADVILFNLADDNASCGLTPLVKLLQGKGFLLETLGMATHSHNVQSYLGVSTGTGPVARRIDIKIYPISAKPFALLQWSGGEYFVRAMKIRASSMGYKLTDVGLFPVSPGNREVIGPSVKLSTEKEIFDFLQVPYDAENPWNQGAVGFGLQAILKK